MRFRHQILNPISILEPPRLGKPLSCLEMKRHAQSLRIHKNLGIFFCFPQRVKVRSLLSKSISKDFCCKDTWIVYVIFILQLVSGKIRKVWSSTLTIRIILRQRKTWRKLSWQFNVVWIALPCSINEHFFFYSRLLWDKAKTIFLPLIKHWLKIA